MPKPIDKNKLKIKHLLRIEGENYPTHEDFFFEVVDALQELDLLNSDFKATDIVKKVKARIKNKRLTPSLQVLVDEGYLSCYEKHGVMYFRLLKHPWESE